MLPNAEPEDQPIHDANEPFRWHLAALAADQSCQANDERQQQSAGAFSRLDATAFARVLEASGDALVVFDGAWRYLYVNELAMMVLGKKRDQLIGHAVTDVFPDIVHTPFWDVYQRAVREQALLTVDAFFEPLDKWFDVRAIPQNGLLYLHFRDVTAQKRAEVHARLREEQTTNLLTNIFMQAPAFMAALRGPDHVFEMANPPYYQLVGHRDIIGKSVAEALPEVVDQGFVELLDQVYRTGEPFLGKDMPILLQTTPEAHLEERYLDFSYQPLFDGNGAVSGILAHGIDSTERKVAEDALRNAEAELARRTRNHVTLVESATDSLARYDRHLRFVFVNPATQDAEAKQRRIADTLQQYLLLTPPASDAFPGLEVDTHYEAAWDEALIGGDYGDAFKVGEHRVALLAGDCTGKGLAAARFVAKCEFMARAFLRENPDDPTDTLARLNRALISGQQLDERPANALTTLAVMVTDTLVGEALVTAGGAEPPLIFRAKSGDVEEVQIAGALLGMDAQAKFDTIRLALSTGDALILTTDGTTEARNRKSRRFFGCDGLIRALEGDVLRGDSLLGTTRKVVDEAKQFAGGALADDVCVLVARFTGASAGKSEKHRTATTNEEAEPLHDLVTGKKC